MECQNNGHFGTSLFCHKFTINMPLHHIAMALQVPQSLTFMEKLNLLCPLLRVL